MRVISDTTIALTTTRAHMHSLTHLPFTCLHSRHFCMDHLGLYPSIFEQTSSTPIAHVKPSLFHHSSVETIYSSCISHSTLTSHRPSWLQLACPTLSWTRASRVCLSLSLMRPTRLDLNSLDVLTGLNESNGFWTSKSFLPLVRIS